MNIVDLRTYRDSAHTPVIILIDLQEEYIAKDRALALHGAEKAIENCKKLLSFARLNGFPVAHMRWAQNSKFFSKKQPYSQWINNFSPLGSDMIFERAMPSCYASETFTEMMNYGGGENAVVAGFTGTFACLSTIIDAYHQDHSITFLSDASASHGIKCKSEQESHNSVVDIISLYAPVATTDHWIAQQEKRHITSQDVIL